MSQGTLYLDDAPPALWQTELACQDDFRALWAREGERFAARRALEQQLARALPAQAEARLQAFCAVCGAERALVYDHNYAAPNAVNWRERLICPECGLNNRQRLALQWVASKLTIPEPRIYATEQTTPVAQALRASYRHFIGSEYFGPEWTGGHCNAAGIRHEDVTALSLPDQSVDWVLSFDVLEHVPDYRRALHEFQRVLAPGGNILLTMPMALGEANNLVRATITGGKIVHHMAPEYHGDPVNPDGGILCFYHFGWQILDDLASAGFSLPRILLNWSLSYGYLGNEQVLIVASKE